MNTDGHGFATPEGRFLAEAHGGRNVFLTGMAGTGKSTLLRRFIGETLRKVDVTAPTGVAALNVGGMTVHRFCGMLLGPEHGQDNEDYFRFLLNDPNRPEDVLKVDADEEGIGGDDAADACRYLAATKGRELRLRKLSGL
jgi:GTPase SAR1 family protein